LKRCALALKKELKAGEYVLKEGDHCKGVVADSSSV
jgi:hypothetical protein